MAIWQSSGEYTHTDKARTIVGLSGDRYFWDASAHRWRVRNGWLVVSDQYMAELLATDGARYLKGSPAIKPKSKRNLRVRVLNGVG